VQHGKESKGKGREGKGRDGMGWDGKGREGKGRGGIHTPEKGDWSSLANLPGPLTPASNPKNLCFKPWSSVAVLPDYLHQILNSFAPKP
jgi:hypothetical protein